MQITCKKRNANGSSLNFMATLQAHPDLWYEHARQLQPAALSSTSQSACRTPRVQACHRMGCRTMPASRESSSDVRALSHRTRNIESNWQRACTRTQRGLKRCNGGRVGARHSSCAGLPNRCDRTDLVCENFAHPRAQWSIAPHRCLEDSGGAVRSRAPQKCH